MQPFLGADQNLSWIKSFRHRQNPKNRWPGLAKILTLPTPKIDDLKKKYNQRSKNRRVVFLDFFGILNPGSTKNRLPMTGQAVTWPPVEGPKFWLAGSFFTGSNCQEELKHRHHFVVIFAKWRSSRMSPERNFEPPFLAHACQFVLKNACIKIILWHHFLPGPTHFTIYQWS